MAVRKSVQAGTVVVSSLAAGSANAWSWGISSLRNSQHLGDDFDRDSGRKRGDQIALRLAFEIVERDIRDVPDALVEPVDRARGEGTRHQPAQPRVLGWIHHEK